VCMCQNLKVKKNKGDVIASLPYNKPTTIEVS
jgi:hypothetical protein